MCKHPSHFGMQLEYPVYKKLHKFIVLSAVVVLVVSLLQRQNGKSCEPGAKMEVSTQPSDMTILIKDNFHIAKLEHACELLLHAMTSGHVMIFKHKSQEVHETRPTGT